jgi:ATP/maltotriose-dependent transcriptional regulator MalT
LSRGSDARLTLTSAPALTALLNELSAVPNDVHLVLDDYRLVDGPEIWSALFHIVFDSARSPYGQPDARYVLVAAR